VLILAVDTMRADRVGPRAGRPSLTPNIDRLASGAVVFESHYAPASWSLPCYASLLTGAWPTRHGVLDQNQKLPQRFYTLAEVLSAYGFRAAGFVGGSHLTGIFDLKQGFEVWADQPNFGSFYHSVPRALAWLDRLQPDQKFLLLVQGYDCHTPYYVPHGLGELFDPDYSGVVHDLDLLDFTRLHLIRDRRYYPGRKVPVSSDPRHQPIGGEYVSLDDADIDHIRAHYDAAVWYSDLWIGILLDELKRRGLYDDTLILLLGDHGEDLMEHGFFFHRNALYRQNIHTPLILKLAGGRHAGRRIAAPVSTVDLLPTLLGLLGATSPAGQVDGRDLGAWLAAEEPAEARPVFSMLSDQRSVVWGRWHLLRRLGQSRRYDPEIELYDLLSDPAEEHDLASARPDVVARLSAALQRWQDEQPRAPRAETVDLDARLENALRAGGYWEHRREDPR